MDTIRNPSPHRRVLLISGDPVGRRMAGLSIRYYELARALRSYVDVVIAGTRTDDEPVSDVPTITYEPHNPTALRAPIEAADAIVAPPQWPLTLRWMRCSGARLIFDIYDPEQLETLELMAARAPVVRSLIYALTLDRLSDALRSGHHFVCASEKQRDLWLGAMLGQRLIQPARYDPDPGFADVIDTVPFGVPAEPPQASGAGARSRFPQIRETDEIVLWNGGIWNWLDASGAVRAAALLSERRPAAKLVFMGVGSSPAGVRATEEAQQLAGELGVLDRSVFFNDRWVPYAERTNWLLEADCALAAQLDHLETRFAFRTRLLDCFWAGLPVVCTAGDDLAARVERDHLGATVPPQDPPAMAAAIERVLDRGKAAYRPALARVGADHAWPVVARPLLRWIGSDSLPPRLGGRPGLSPGRSLPQSFRTAGYLASRAALARLGAGWPSLRH